MSSVPSDHDFTWRDGERTIVFREGALAGASELLAEGIWERFELLTTPRALAAAPIELAERASAVHEVPRGPVPEAAATIVDSVRNPTLVALGGGRVIDTAKAIAAVRGGRVCALPTTLSGAEMTAIHRLPGRPRARGPAPGPPYPGARRPVRDDHPRRPAPAGERDELARPWSRGSLHAARQPCGHAGRAARRRAARRGARPPSAGARPGGVLPSARCCAPPRSTRSGYALHHVVCQTLVWVLGTPHAETNATILPLTMEAMRSRAPARSSRWPGRWERAPTGSGSGSRAWAAGRDGWATSAQTAAV